MMSRKLLITSVLLVVLYSSAYYVGTMLEKKNVVLNEVLHDILQDEIITNDVLGSVIEQKSLKKKSLFDFSAQLQFEVDLILDLVDKPGYKDTDYVRDLFDKYEIDCSILKKDLSQPIIKHQLYNQLNINLAKYLEFLECKIGDLSHLKCQIVNRYDTYQVNELNRLDFQFYEQHIYGNAVKYFYETGGKRQRITSIPLVLDHIPDEINFVLTMEDLVTGELRTIKSKLRP